MTDGPPRVVVADDQILVRTGFRMILTAHGIDVVAEAGDGEEAVKAVRRTRPDVVLMDIRMPRLDGLEATRRILTGTPGEPRVIILTTFDLDQVVYDALAAGAAGFLLKDVTPEHLVAAVRLIRTGDALLSPAITRRLVERHGGGAHGHRAHGEPGTGPGTGGGHRMDGRPAPAAGAGDRHPDLTALTPRELEVLCLLAQGLSNTELAARLHLSETTVKTHVSRILAKLRLRDRVQAVIVAYRTGLVSPAEQ
ncbi:response regulator [Streptomyces sp. NPDC058295]|uniref:response regulator transcription factor n=1 Tax=Streptomyces sp. NPDC058295 TaxID=3346431 RepID=UPI0036F09EA6